MSKELTDAKRRAIAKYDAQNTRQIHLKLNVNTDNDILARFEETENVQGYIKALIRKDIAARPKKYPPTRYADTLYGCPSCGYELPSGKPKVCTNCGQLIDWNEIT